MLPDPIGPGVEGVGVGAGQTGGPRQGLDHSRPEGRLEDGQHFGPNPDPGEGGIHVVRVRPGLQARILAGGVTRRRDDHGPGHVQQWPSEQVRTRWHPRQRARTRAARQPQQHRLGLVVAGVPEQDRCSVPGAGREEPARVATVGPRLDRAARAPQKSGVASPTRGGLEPPRTRASFDLHRHDFDVVATEDAGLLRGALRDRCRTGLHAVVDHRRRAHESLVAAHRDGRGQQRQRIGSSAQCDQHPIARGQVGQAVPDRRSDDGPRRPAARHRASTRPPIGRAARCLPVAHRRGSIICPVMRQTW